MTFVAGLVLVAVGASPDAALAQGAVAIDTRGAGTLSDEVRSGGLLGRWRFGVAELDDANARLMVAGQAHELDHSSHELLRCLLAHAGSVVLKQQLLDAGWPGRVVSENSLAKAIGRLRLALQDPQGDILSTVHGYGYRLGAQAEFLPVADTVPAGNRPATLPDRRVTLPAATVTAPKTRRGHVQRLGLSLLGLALLMATFLLDLPTPQSNQATGIARPPITQPSIAILPFADMSQAGDQEYFSDGLADELLDQLSKLPQLRVAGRTSSFSFRGTGADVASIGRKLNVAYVLEGSVRKSGERIRITVQLISVHDGFHLWSETYDRKMTDLFAVQDEIARSVVAALQLKLMPGQNAAVTQHATSSPEAYTQFLLGRKLRSYGTPDNDRRAIAAFEKAIALDRKFASAYAGLADVLGGAAEYADTPQEVAAGKRKSLAMMDKAIALNPNLADTYLARADFLYSTNWDWTGAQRDLDKAAALNPGENPGTMMRQCRLLAALGRLPEAIALERRATELDPVSVWAWSMLGYHSAVIGQYAEARHALAQAEKLQPGDNHINFYAGLTSMLAGKSEVALLEFERSGGPFRLAGLAMAQHDAGQAARSQQSLEVLISKFADTAAYQVAEVYAWRGQTDQAFAWLDRANSQRDAGLIYLKFDPLLKKLHSDPRYAQWLRKMRLLS